MNVFPFLSPKSCAQVFLANLYGNVTVEMLFPKPIIARYLRILPSTCGGRCIMKFEVLGVNLTSCPPGKSLIFFECLQRQGEYGMVICWMGLCVSPSTSLSLTFPPFLSPCPSLYIHQSLPIDTEYNKSLDR